MGLALRAGSAGASPAAAPALITNADAPRSVVEYGTRRLLIVSGVMLAALLQTLDSTIVNVALPTIQGNLGASIDEATWVVTAYIIAAVIVIPITPWLQSFFGRKQYFLISIAGFTIASAMCGVAGSIDELIVFRVIQGLFGGGLLATSQAILRDTFPPAQLGLSQAIYTMGAVVGPSTGPTLGGILTDNFSWRWVFDVNIVPGVIAILLLLPLLKNPSKPSRNAIDLGGLALLALGLGSLQYVLDEGERNDWFNDSGIVTFSILAVAGLVTFVYWELRVASRPIVDLRVLRNRAVAVGLLLAIANAVLVFGQLLVMPQYLTNILGFTATQDGVLLAARALPVAILTMPIGLLVGRSKIDKRLLVGLGLACSGLGAIGLSQQTTAQTPFEVTLPWLMLSGLGISFVFTPLLVAVLGAVPRADSPKAGAFISLALNLGGSISSALLVTLLDRRAAFHQSVFAASVNAGRTSVETFLQHGTALQLAGMVATQAQVAAYADVFRMIGLVTIVMAPLAYFLKPVKS